MNKYLKTILIIFYYFIYNIIIYIPFIILDINLTTIPDNLFYLYYISDEIIFIVSLLYVYRHDFKKYIQDFKENGKQHLKFGFNYWLIGVSVMIISNILISQFSPISIPENEQAVREALGLSPLFIAFSSIICAPLLEEILFRKTLYDVFKNKTIYILISGLAFGAFHIIGIGTSLYSWLYIVPYGALGVSFAYIYVKTKNLFTPICLHSFHNIITVVQIILLSMLGG